MRRYFNPGKEVQQIKDLLQAFTYHFVHNSTSDFVQYFAMSTFIAVRLNRLYLFTFCLFSLVDIKDELTSILQ